MQFAAAGRIGLVDMIIPRLCLNSVALSGIRTTPSKNCSTGSFLPPGLQHFIAYPSGFAPAILDTASAGAAAICSAYKEAQCALYAENVRPQKLRGKIMKGGLPACPWRRKYGSRNAGKSKGRFRRKSVWRWRKSRTQDFFHIMLARRVSRTEASLRKCAALSFICT